MRQDHFSTSATSTENQLPFTTDGHQVTPPPPPLGNRTTTAHAHLQAQNLQHKTKE